MPDRRECKYIPSLEKAAQRLYLFGEEIEEIPGMIDILLFWLVDSIFIDAVPLSQAFDVNLLCSAPSPDLCNLDQEGICEFGLAR